MIKLSLALLILLPQLALARGQYVCRQNCDLIQETHSCAVTTQYSAWTAVAPVDMKERDWKGQKDPFICGVEEWDGRTSEQTLKIQSVVSGPTGKGTIYKVSIDCNRPDDGYPPVWYRGFSWSNAENEDEFAFNKARPNSGDLEIQYISHGNLFSSLPIQIFIEKLPGQKGKFLTLDTTTGEVLFKSTIGKCRRVKDGKSFSTFPLTVPATKELLEKHSRPTRSSSAWNKTKELLDLFKPYASPPGY